MKNCGIVVKKKAVNTVVIPYLKGIETHGRLTYTRR